MTTRIQPNPHVPPANPTRSTGAASALPETAVAIAIGRTTSPLGNELSASGAISQADLSAAISIVLDPFAMMTGLQAQLRDTQSTTAQQGVEASSLRAEAAEAQKAEFLEKAMEAANRLTNRMPKWVKKLVGAVVTAIAAVGAIYTGGASLALAVAGVALMVAGEVVEKLAENGKIDPQKAAWVSLAFKVVGAALMAVSGNVSGVAALPAALKTAATVVKVAVAVGQAAEAGVDIAHAKFQADASKLTISADGQQIVVDLALDDIEEETEAAKEIEARFQRTMRRIHAMVAAQGQAMDAAVRVPA